MLNSRTRQNGLNDGGELAVLLKVSRLLEILVRLHLEIIGKNRTSAELIAILDSVGCGQSEIAELLGTTANTVNVALYRAKKRHQTKGKRHD